MKEKIKRHIPIFFLDYLRRYRDIKYTIKFRMQYLQESRLSSFTCALKPFLLSKKVITYYPIRPSYAYLEFKLCVLLGFTITDNLKSNSQVIHRRDFDTKSNLHDDLKSVNPNVKINFSTIDISKRQVQIVFEDVFGYPLAVDPQTYPGKFVKKSDINYTHDGIVLEHPLTENQIEQGYVYEKLIDNSINAEEVMDIRVPVINETIPMLQLKIRPKHDRFSNNNTSVTSVKPETVLTDHEIDKLVEFARVMQLEFSEMDVLRDKKDGQLYIVDCNSTPAFGPPPGMPIDQQSKYLIALAQSYRDLVMAK